MQQFPPIARTRSTAKTNWPLLATIITAVLLGGASRGDVLPLLVLRPASALLLAWAVYRHGATAWRHSAVLTGLGAAVILLVFLQLVPLPPALWSALAGRAFVVEIYETAQIPAPWLPLAMDPAGATNALFSLMLPMAVGILALAASADALQQALRVIIVAALVSAAIGLVQILGPANGPLYFYDVTNNGVAVGFFANRNHQAVLLAALFPLLAFHASTSSQRAGRQTFVLLTSMAAAAFVAPMILITGSRSGLALGLLGLLLAAWVLAPGQLARSASANPVAKRFRRLLPAVAITGLALLAALTVAASRGLAFERLIAAETSEELRFQTWPTIWQMALDTFPWGTGFGVFDPLYRVYEPGQLLSEKYLNHAHNDWLQVILNGGLAGAALLTIGTGLLAYAVFKLARTRSDKGLPRDHAAMARCAAVILILLMAASAVDYPLRTPALATLAALCAAIIARVNAAARHPHPYLRNRA